MFNVCIERDALKTIHGELRPNHPRVVYVHGTDFDDFRFKRDYH